MAHRLLGIKRKLKKHIGFCLCLIIVVVLGVLYVSHGENMPVVSHDQLDDQVICYKLAAENPGASFYEQIMGGQSAQVMAVTVPGMLLFYQLFVPYFAYALNLLLVMLVAYASLYFCLEILGTRDVLAALISFVYAALPSYSVYGLSAMGVPLILLAVLLVLRRGKIIVPVLLCLFFVLYSSLILAGFAICACLMFACIYEMIRKDKGSALKIAFLLLIIAATYICMNLDLLSYSLSNDNPSNRTEYRLTAEPFLLQSIWSFFLSGHYHASSCNYYLAVLDLAVFPLVGLWIFMRKKQDNITVHVLPLFKYVGFGLIFASLIAVFYVAFHTEPIVEFRETLPGSLSSFQFDRFYFLYPCIWYVVSGLTFEMLVRIGQQRGDVIWAWIAILLTLAMTVSTIGKTSVVLINAKEVITGKESGQMTWREFYAEDLLREIKQDLDELSDGVDYRVISVGFIQQLRFTTALQRSMAIRRDTHFRTSMNSRRSSKGSWISQKN